jgi:aspartate aminotransferase
MSVGQSATLKLNELANNLKAEGKPVIHLGGGEPEEKIPQGAYAAAVKKLDTRSIRCTATDGTRDLKKEISAYTERISGFRPAAKNIVVSGGAKQAIYNFLMAVVDPGSEVVFPAPYWVSYPEMVKLAYGTPVIVRPEPGRLLPDMREMEKHITSNTRAVMLNSPNNPSGMMYPEAFLRELAEICEARGVYLMMDDIYGRLVIDGAAAPNTFALSGKPLDESVVVSINGVSKSYSMTGFRVGWSVAGEAISQAMAKIQAQVTSCPSALSQAAAVGALAAEDNFVDGLRSQLEKKRDLLIGELRKLKKINIHQPQGTFYSFPDFSAYEKDSEKLSRLLLDKVMVVTVPGREFGLDGHLRLSYCGSEKDITEGVERIRKVLDA